MIVPRYVRLKFLKLCLVLIFLQRNFAILTSSIEFLPKSIWSLMLPPFFVSNDEVNKVESSLLWIPTCLAQLLIDRNKIIKGKKNFINYFF
jgi:hypothetical protein